jgi:hypothetical protein
MKMYFPEEFNVDNIHTISLTEEEELFLDLRNELKSMLVHFSKNPHLYNYIISKVNEKISNILQTQ